MLVLGFLSLIVLVPLWVALLVGNITYGSVIKQRAVQWAAVEAGWATADALEQFEYTVAA